MIKIFVTGDNHFGKKYDRYPEIRDRLVDNRFVCFEKMVEKAEQEGCDIFAVTGDLFDNCSSIRKSDVERVVRILAGFAGRVLVLPGNHDYYTGEEKVWKDFDDALRTCDNNIIRLDRFEPYPIEIAEETVVIYPAFCRSKHSRENNLGWIKEMSVPKSGQINVGMLFQIVEQQKRAGAAVTAGVVMVEFQPQMVTERIQLMILQIRICLSAHLAGTQIGSLRLPVDVIVMQAAGQHPQIKRRVVRNQNALLQHRLQQLPERREVRLAAHHLRRDAGQRDIERVKMCLRVNERIKFLYDLPVFDHAHTDGAHAPVLCVWRFHVECDVSFFHASTPSDRMGSV